MIKAKVDSEKIKTYAQEKHGSVHKFSDVIGVSKTRLYAFINGEQEASGNIWESLVGYFGKDIFDYVYFFEIKPLKRGRGAKRRDY